jgi:hypothetical protein
MTATRATKPKKASPRQVEEVRARHQRQNREAAELILRNRERYAGLPVEWAELWLKRNVP